MGDNTCPDCGCAYGEDNTDPAGQFKSKCGACYCHGDFIAPPYMPAEYYQDL